MTTTINDAVVIGEDWISEHYFTTTANSQSFRAQVLARRKIWEAQKDIGSVRTRFTAARAELLGRFSALADDPDSADELGKRLRDIFGFDAVGFGHKVTGPVTLVDQITLHDVPGVALISARPVETVEDLLEKDSLTLAEPYDLDETHAITSVSRLLSSLFVADDAPAFALVLAGRTILLAERERWPEGRYLSIDLQLVCERNDDKKGGEVDTVLTCLSAESLAPDAEGNIAWHTYLADSIKHTIGVSQDLREGVRLSIEIIANDVVSRRVLQGLEPLPQSAAQPLAKQSLRFLYRVLFLLFAEASPELGVLPVGTPEYEQGYSLGRLRELIQVPLTTPAAENGTHLYESLAVLFRLVDNGSPDTGGQREEGVHEALTFRSLRADLFHPAATAVIDQVKLGNAQLQRVLDHLLLSKKQAGRDRGFISYAELGINQLGAVYEGLMSFTGRFADTDLYEVAKGGDGSKGTWLVPFERADSIDEKDFVKVEDPITGEKKPVHHKPGAFVFRLAGRERQQSASYYTPEVLTRFTVSQALEELLDQDGHKTTAEEILAMTVCEPALGSGAFAIEAVRQLAAAYLTRRQDELGERIDPEHYAQELQKVKAYLALHNAYGVDLNATAVELAEISLWLDTMVAGLHAPWFGLHLRRGNSLIGARHAVYTRRQVEQRAWLKDVPRDVPLSEMPSDIAEGRDGSASGNIHHFLLPAEGWGAAIGAKEARALAPESLDRLKKWRKSVLIKPTKKQTDALVSLGLRVEALWRLAWRRLSIAESEVRRNVEVWGANVKRGGTVTREQIESSLGNKNGAYRRLGRAMDAWCALWFWPLTEETAPPSLDEWIETLQKLLGSAGTVSQRRAGQDTLGGAANWEELGEVEELDLSFSAAADVEAILDQHPWLAAAERVAAQQGFLHWELDFAPVFTAGGFDLQVGNPPWVRPRSDVEALLAEADPWWQLKAKSTAAEDASHREAALAVDGTVGLLLDGTVEVAASAAYLGAAAEYPHLVGLQPDLYRCFMEQTWRHTRTTGSVGLVHPETHFTDEKAGVVRSTAYRRLRRHWQFINELTLFEVDHHVGFGVHVYGSDREPDYLQATSLYHPDTVERSLHHDGSGTEPGLKDDNGSWDLRPHAKRIQRVTSQTLATWHALLEHPDSPVASSRMVYTVNTSTAAVLSKLATAPRLGELDLQFSRGWDESIDRKKGYFDAAWGVPESWDSVILQGPHIHVNTPFYKTPNRSMRNNQDWTAVDLRTISSNEIPATIYKPRGGSLEYDKAYTRWHLGGKPTSPRNYYRMAYRAMAANTGERTLIPALIPPGTAHVNVVFSIGGPGTLASDLASVCGFCSSLLADLVVRAAPKSNIYQSVIERIPVVADHPLRSHLVLRVARLNCVTSAYAKFWNDLFEPEFQQDAWSAPHEDSITAIGDCGPTWTTNTVLRSSIDRQQAAIEIDALVALMLDISEDEL